MNNSSINQTASMTTQCIKRMEERINQKPGLDEIQQTVQWSTKEIIYKAVVTRILNVENTRAMESATANKVTNPTIIKQINMCEQIQEQIMSSLVKINTTTVQGNATNHRKSNDKTATLTSISTKINETHNRQANHKGRKAAENVTQIQERHGKLEDKILEKIKDQSENIPAAMAHQHSQNAKLGLSHTVGNFN